MEVGDWYLCFLFLLGDLSLSKNVQGQPVETTKLSDSRVNSSVLY